MTKLNSKEAQILALLRCGEQERALGVFQRVLGPGLRHLLATKCDWLDESTRKDIYIETLTRVWQKHAQYDPAKGAFRTWVYRVAQNLAIDRWRKDTKVERRAREDQEARAGPEFNEYRASVLGVIGKLSPLQRTIVQLDLEAWPGKIRAELIAQRLGITTSSLYTQRNKAYLRLREFTGRARLRGGPLARRTQ